MSLQAILAGTPVWVWVLLAVLVSRGIKAMKGGTAPLSKLAVVPAIFAAWGLLHIVSGPSTGWQAAAMWLVGGLFGMGTGAVLAKNSAITVDRVQRTVTVPGSVVPMLLILATFASKLFIGFEMAASAGVDSTLIALNALISGVIAGIFAGRFLFYWLALRPAAAVFERV